MTIRKFVVALTFALSPVGLAAQALRVEPTPAAATAPTPVPALVPYSGTALGADGRPLAGEMYVTLLIFKEEHGGAPLWSEGQRAVADSAGRYKVQLGAASPNGLPSGLFSSGEARWLQVQIGGQPEQPRVLLASVPYALKAGDATTLGGLPASAFALAGGAAVTQTGPVVTPDTVTSATSTTVTTTGGTTGYIPKFTGAATIADSQVFDTGTTVGIGVGTSPNSHAKLDVGGAMIVRGNTIVSRTNNATPSQAYPSWGFEFFSNAYNSSTKTTANPYFTLQSEPTGNNTASPSATFNLLFANGGATAETGFYINPNGTLHFAPAQTFPSGSTAVAHNATLTGDGTSGTPLGLTVPISVSGSAYGVVRAVDTGSGEGLFGESASGIGVSGYGQGASGIGVEATSDNYIGVKSYGYTEGVDATGLIGVKATALANSGATYGVYGTGYTGVYGVSSRATGTGVYGEADNNSGADYAVWGVSSSGYAGVFQGNVSIQGTLTKTAGTFKIDDPLDPANKYLSHSFVESPDMMNIYNGNAQLDASGQAVVELPDYFTALNKEYRYQLTAMGAPGPNLYIAEEVTGNRFKIAGGQAGSKVSWQVTGIRQDAYANAHRTPIEELKPEKERGTYLHPELFGQPEEKGREWAIHPEMMAASKKDKAK